MVRGARSACTECHRYPGRCSAFPLREQTRSLPPLSCSPRASQPEAILIPEVLSTSAGALWATLGQPRAPARRAWGSEAQARSVSIVKTPCGKSTTSISTAHPQTKFRPCSARVIYRRPPLRHQQRQRPSGSEVRLATCTSVPDAWAPNPTERARNRRASQCQHWPPASCRTSRTVLAITRLPNAGHSRVITKISIGGRGRRRPAPTAVPSRQARRCPVHPENERMRIAHTATLARDAPGRSSASSGRIGKGAA